MKNHSIYGIVAAVLFSFGAASAWAEGDKVDCSTANDDIATLQGEVADAFSMRCRHYSN